MPIAPHKVPEKAEATKVNLTPFGFEPDPVRLN